MNVRQIKALESEECPSWLKQLVRHWHQHSSTIITFNYDVLLELAFLLYADLGKSWLDLYPVPIEPAGGRRGAVLGGGSLGGARVKPLEWLRVVSPGSWDKHDQLFG